MPREFAVDRNSSGRPRTRGDERLLSALARQQYGAISRRQLLELGIGENQIGHRVAVGRLHPLHRGVYTLGHRSIPRHGRWMAAVLASGPEAVLSHSSAAALWGIRPRAGREGGDSGDFRSPDDLRPCGC